MTAGTFPQVDKRRWKEQQRVETFREVCDGYRPAMHHFFLERWQLPADWFARRVAYANSVSTGVEGHTDTSRLHLGYISATSRLYLGSISAYIYLLRRIGDASHTVALLRALLIFALDRHPGHLADGGYMGLVTCGYMDMVVTTCACTCGHKVVTW